MTDDPYNGPKIVDWIADMELEAGIEKQGAMPEKRPSAVHAFARLVLALYEIAEAVRAAGRLADETRVLFKDFARRGETILRADLEERWGDTRLAHFVAQRLPMWLVFHILDWTGEHG